MIDQVLAGWYGGFAVEAMAMGKPVACYIRDEDLAVIPTGMRRQLPLVRVHPDTLEQDLEAAIAQRASWPSGGQRRAISCCAGTIRAGSPPPCCGATSDPSSPSR